nr:hypothetical protein [Desulfobulbaceae bacterium]
MEKRMRLGDLLVKKGLVKSEQVDEALRIQVGGNRRLGYILIKMGAITDNQLLEVLSGQLDVPIIKIDDEFSVEVKNVLPRYLCQKYTVAPLSKEPSNILSLAMMDASDEAAISDIENYTGMVVKPMLAREKDITSAIKQHIPFSSKDIFNPHVFSRATKVTSTVALVLLVIVGVVFYNYVQTEKYGTISVIGDSKTYKNHDLMVGIEGSGKISLLGHGAYSKGFYSVTFNSEGPLQTFVEQKRKNFSDKQYDWLMWVVEKNLSVAK